MAVTRGDPDVGPDEATFRSHLSGGAYRSGETAGAWKLHELDWPFVEFDLSVPTRPGGPETFRLRLLVEQYPTLAPTGSLWDPDTKEWLAAEKRPKGPDEQVMVLFRVSGWPAGEVRAMYAAWDRLGLSTHGNWARDNPDTMWTSERDIAFLLRSVHEELNSGRYHHV